MARVAPNGLIVSDGGQWCWLTNKWYGYLNNPTETCPGPADGKAAATSMRAEQQRVSGIALQRGERLPHDDRAKRFKQLTAECGTIEAAEKRLRSQYGLDENNMEVAAPTSVPPVSDRTGVVPPAAAVSGLPMDKLHKRAEEILGASLGKDEAVLGRLNGIDKTQVLVLTDQRALILKVGWRSGQTLGGKVTSFEYRNITSVEVRASMVTGSFEIAAGGVSGAERSYWDSKGNDAWHAPNAIPIGKSQMANFQQAAALIRERARPAAEPSTVAPSYVPNVLDHIKQLGALRDAGILTEEEFAKKKAELLERL